MRKPTLEDYGSGVFFPSLPAAPPARMTPDPVMATGTSGSKEEELRDKRLDAERKKNEAAAKRAADLLQFVMGDICPRGLIEC